MNGPHTAHYRRFFFPAGVFLNAIAIFFRFNLPLRYRKRGFLLLALTYLFHADSLRLGLDVNFLEYRDHISIISKSPR